MGNLLTVCALEKIDACPIEGFEAESYNEFLGLKELDLKSVLVLAVGYRAEDDMFSTMKKVRRGVEKVVIEK
jgi:nitroreductase/dihydropteridine reductase